MVSPDVLRHVVDVHCHPTDSPVASEIMEALSITICAMGTRQEDQALVRDLATSYPEKVVPCFGYHPWFSHRITLKPNVPKEDHYRSLFSPSNDEENQILEVLLNVLPEPLTLEEVVSDVRRNLEAFPDAMLGEVGLDRSYRVAYDYFASPRKLTPFTIPVDHQLVILHAQINVAIELGRNISLHSVKSQQATMDLLSQLRIRHGAKFDRISLDMHSCGFSPTMWKDIQRKYSNVFLSLSTTINGRSPNHRVLIDACTPDRILVESDFHDVSECTERTWDIVKTIAEVKGWHIETEWAEEGDGVQPGVVHTLERNWRSFKAGNHSPAISRKKIKKAQDWVGDESSEEK
ncbi:dnase family scn1 [Moniliophthora roreri MCA 2997]|uniref:Dnase family scn1 n=1 Tax=Moniliophthora roreri (strain MCA 2997) TaxID=1381753 RepID=V2XIQ0_MONRO|nr:dnase family scn1 [Moniliophthora roreri MCA 2997]